MTIKKNDARSSNLADGTALTTTNAPFTDNFSSLTLTAGGTATMNAAQKTYVAAAPDTGVSRLEWNINTTHAVAVVMFNFTNVSTILDNRILTLFSTGQNGGAGINLVSGALRFTDFAGASKLLTTQTVYGKRVRVYIGQEIGTGTADGELHFKAFFGTDADSATQGSASTGAVYDSAIGNSGTVNFSQLRVGKLGSGNAVSVPIEYIYLDDTTYTDPGPLAAPNSAPIVNAGPDQTNLEPYSPVILVGTDSDADGSVATRSWTQTGGSPAVVLAGTNTAICSFEAPGTIAGTNLTFTYSATDNLGLTSTDTVVTSILPVTERAVVGGVEVPMRMRNAASYGNIVNNTPAVDWFKLDGNTTDTKGGPSGTTWSRYGSSIVPTVTGQSAVFATGDTPVTVPGKTYNLAPGFSAEIWIKPTTLTGLLQYPLAWKNTTGDMWGFWVWGADAAFFINIDGTFFNATANPGMIAVNNLYHIVGTYDGTTMRCYLNGVQRSTNTTVAPDVNAGTLTIGAFDVAFLEFIGSVSNIATYNKVLTPSQIYSRYLAGLAN